MAKLTNDELSKISEILNPLNKDPLRSEILNPMSRALRRIKGLPELPPEKEDELVQDDIPLDVKNTEDGIEVSEEDFPDADTTTPPQMKYFDDGDIDIDALLNDASDVISGQPTAKKPNQSEVIQTEPTENDDSLEADDPFASADEFAETDSATDPTNEIEQSQPEDPFADFADTTDTEGTNADKPEEDDPFAALDASSADPFADSSTEKDSNESEDPFAGFGEDTESETVSEKLEDSEEDLFSEPASTQETADAEDPFAGFGEQESPTEDITEEDPFGALDSSGEDDPFATVDSSSEDDPFANVGDAFDKESGATAMDTDPFADALPSGDADDDPFADLGTPTATTDDPFADFDSGETLDSTNDDPFAAVGNTEPEDDPFAVSDESQPVASDDPFADIGQDSPLEADDPFGGIGESQPVASDDPFGDFGADTTEEADPFGGLGEIESTPSPADDPFGEDFGSPSDISSSENTGYADSDVFGDLGSPQDSASSSSFDSGPIDDDPFADLQESTTLGQGFGDGAADDYGSSFGDLGGGIGDVGGDTNSSLGAMDYGSSTESSYDSLEEDLDSLAQEEEPEEELNDEELAIIQQEILKYPPKLKRTVIDVITNDRLPKSDQRELIELIKASQKPEDIAGYLSEKLGYEVDLIDKTGAYSERGIPVIATKPIYTKEGELKRRQLIKRTALIAAAALLLVTGLISTYKYGIRPFQAARHYKEGIEYIKKAGLTKETSEKQKALADAMVSFSKGEKIEPNNLEYLNKFGIAYGRIGEYDKAFEKLFGVVEPDFGREKNGEMESWTKRLEVPYIELSPKTPWDNEKLPIGGRVVPDNESLFLVSGSGKKKVERKIKIAGAYIVARLEKNIHDNSTYINLGKFHSNIANLFNKPLMGTSRSYKNDNLAVAYFKEVFTDGEDENNVEATAGLAKVYYNQKNFAKSVFYYNKIVEKFPDNPIGHGGLLSNYIEMWKGDQNPQFVLNHHRQVRNALGIEDDLSLFVLAKLAAFYIDLNASEVRIKYNINPEDQVTNMDLDDNVEHLLNIAFFKTEKGEDGEDIKGDEFAEGYYQRGRFLINKGESIQALQQFEFAASYDPAHYLAVMEMGEHYMRLNNYAESFDLLANAEKRYATYKDFYGNKEEDETLLNGDPGRIHFDKGKIVFMESSLLSKDGKISEFPDRKVYPDKSLSQLSEEESNRRKNLNNAMQKFDIALSLNLKDPKLKRELYYYKGWIEYIRSDYETALNEWSNLSEDDVYLNSNVMIGRANAFYHLEQLNASLGNLIKIKEDFEDKESDIARPTPEESAHQEIYNVLIAVYNNIGAVYERKGNSAQALKHYWKAIEIARKIGLTTEIANYNKDMVFKARPGGALPLLDDWLSPTIDTVKELQNTKKGRL